MSDEEEKSGGCGGRGSGGETYFADCEGVITYKRRRKCGALGSGSCLQGGAGVSPGGQKATGLPHVICNGACKMGGLTRIGYHWKAILEEMLLSQDAGDGSVWNCIQKALAFGHLGCFTSNLNDHAAQKYVCEGNEYLCGEAEGANNFLNAAKKQEATFTELQMETSEQADAHVIKIQNVLVEVLTSEKFALLCDLLLRNFPGIKASSIFNFSLINAKMKNEAHGYSLGHFHQDLQQVWKRIQKIGQEMALLATSLSDISQTAYQKRRLSEFGAEENSIDSHTTTQFPYESDPSTKPEQTEVSCLYKVSICKQCGAEADGKCSLICDGCEAAYHFSCVKPAVQGIPTRNWYCSTCTRDWRQSAEPDITNAHQDGPHQSCTVCDRLKVLGVLKQLTQNDRDDAIANDSRESSVSSMDSEGPPQLSRTALSCLCKICGTCVDAERKFIICGHNLCLYKYYHIRCLRTSQTQKSNHQGSWYCPSCLCRACLTDKDDDMIVMCDGCDEAYHTYCMKPPRTSVPEGKWYCVPCNIKRAKEGMRRYEDWVLQQHGKSEQKLTSGSKRSMEILLNAAEKVERLAASTKNRL